MNPWRKIDSQLPPAAGRPAPVEGTEVAGSPATGGTGQGVSVGPGVEVGVSVGVDVGVRVGVSVGVGEGVIVGVSVGVGEGVRVGMSVGIGEGVRVGGTGVGAGLRVLVGNG